ncbi:PIH1-domain-containing protein [Ceratobasidium sp. AG-I]|nr:PIH1-domain-containing protein [Ceratobasidium sp. AG-I]
MASSTPSHGGSAVPVQIAPDPAFCIKSRVLPDGHKLFVNICHHSAVPPADGNLPLILSDRRDGTDKSGQPCIIFDAVFNPALCAKAATDAELRSTLIDVALSRIEQASGFTLSRTIATPNIKSKGPIPPRTARIPAFWAAREAPVQEIEGPTIPTWTWTPTREGCRIVIHVPELTKALHRSSTLDIEARRLLFSAGTRYQLDTPLLATPAAGSNSGENKTPNKPVGGTSFLPTTVDPDSAVAEWSVKKKELAIILKWASAAAKEREKEA